MLPVRVFELALLAAVPSIPEPVAQPKPAAYELEWSAPEACPDDEAVRKAIARLAEPSPAGEGVLYVHAFVKETPQGFSLTLDTEYLGHRSARSLEAARCSELGDATALVVATSLDADASVEFPTTPGTDDNRAPIAPAEASLDEDPFVTPRPSPSHAEVEPASAPGRAPPELAVRLGARLEYGGLPGVGGGTDLAIAVAWRRFRLEARGTHLWPRTGSGPRDTSAGYQLGTAALAGCARVWVRQVELPLCGGIEAGAMRVATRESSPSLTVHTPWAAPFAGAGVAAGGQRVRFWSMAELAVTAVRSRILVGDTTAFQTLPVSLRLVAGLEIFFAIKRG